MMRWILGLLVVANVLFFAVMRWGGALAVDANNPPVQAALNADKIKLANVNAPAPPVSAVPAISAVASAVAMGASAHAVAVPPGKLSCMEWGEFSGTDLQRAEKALAAMKLGDRLKQRVVEYASGYWVYIAPMKTHAQVEQKVAQLKSRGVTDYFVVQEAGSWQNAISLGVFKTEDAAKKYLAKLQERGVKTALIGERASKLKFTVFALSHLENGLSAQIAGLRKDFPESELNLVSCNASCN
ncbi:MAG: SPOR domain-containing protein [Gallionellaceae bacterium]|nr:MAG: SPOR domain-containing protein [Gallionellaceae bacterium]